MKNAVVCSIDLFFFYLVDVQWKGKEISLSSFCIQSWKLLPKIDYWIFKELYVAKEEAFVVDLCISDILNNNFESYKYWTVCSGKTDVDYEVRCSRKVLDFWKNFFNLVFINFRVSIIFASLWIVASKLASLSLESLKLQNILYVPFAASKRKTQCSFFSF